MKKMILQITTALVFGVSVTKVMAQNPAVILAPKYFYNENLLPLPVPLLNNSPGYPEDGYDGQPALNSQNIQVNREGKIMFFIVDGVFYDRQGRYIDAMTRLFGEDYTVAIPGYKSEVVVVPVPNQTTCTAEYYIFSTDLEGANYVGSSAFFSRFRIEYTLNDELVLGSGFQEIPFNGGVVKALSLSNYVGNALYYAPGFSDHDNHQSTVSMACIKKNNQSSYFLFVLDMQDLKIFSVDNSGQLSFLGRKLIGEGFFSMNVAVETNRKELEVVALANGHYRLGMNLRGVLSNGGGGVNFVYTVDVNANGQYIPASDNFLNYNQITGSTDALIIKGIEFSPSGERMYVSHTKTALYDNVLDLLDLRTTPPSLSVIDIPNLDESIYEYSQIESGLPTVSGNSSSGTILIPANDRLSRIKNADNPSFPSDFESNYLSLSSYAITAPYDINLMSEGEKVRLMQDQMDGFNYNSVSSVEYDQYNYTATTSATWQPNTSTAPNNNPVTRTTASTVYIKDELRIPAGITITIKNMRFEFAPEAKVLVEKGTGALNGGKLVLDNTVFTADDRCKEDMWKGVEVQGISTENQSLSNTKQGVFMATNNSVVEYALIGALANNGGVIRVNNSSFINNHTGVQIRTYSAPNGSGNKCRIEKSSFIWNDALRRPAGGLFNHVSVLGTDGVYIVNNLFANNITNNNMALFRGGCGVRGFNANFNVIAACTDLTMGTTCPSNKKNIFRNLELGVFAFNLNRKAFMVDQTEIYNCRVGITALYAQGEVLTRNKIAVREEVLPTFQPQKYGILLERSTGYKVEDNFLTNADYPGIALSEANTYGIVIRNSGENDNRIYRNQFEKLKIGSQAEGTNAKLNVPLNDNYSRIGLKWKCNRFLNDIFQHDLIVTNGIVDYQQGYWSSSSIAGSLAANNQFSLDNEGGEHDIKLHNSKDIDYVYVNGLRMKPDAYTYLAGSGNSVGLRAQGDGNITYNNNFCPSSFSPRIANPREVREVRLNLGSLVSSLTAKLEQGDTDALLEAIRKYTNLEELKPILMERSPYLSDRMLDALMDKNPGSSYLKDVLIANSALNRPIIERVNRLNLPNGTKQQIALAQKGLNPRESLRAEIAYYTSEMEVLSNRLIYDLQADSIPESELIQELETLNRVSDKKQLLEIHLKNDNQTKTTAVSQELLSRGVSQDYIELAYIRKEMNPYATIQDAFVSISDLATRLTDKTGSTDEEVKEMAQSLLDLNQRRIAIKPFTEVQPQRSGSVVPDKDEAVIKYSSTLATIYPNPSTGRFFIDLPNEDEGTLKVEIFDITGKPVYINEFTQTNGEQIDLTGAVKGLYLVKFTLDNALLEVQKLELK